jgi:hypothetical protein
MKGGRFREAIMAEQMLNEYLVTIPIREGDTLDDFLARAREAYFDHVEDEYRKLMSEPTVPLGTILAELEAMPTVNGAASGTELLPR